MSAQVLYIFVRATLNEGGPSSGKTDNNSDVAIFAAWGWDQSARGQFKLGSVALNTLGLPNTRPISYVNKI